MDAQALEVLGPRPRVAVHQEGANGEPVAERGRLVDEVAVRHVAFVAGWQEQELAALALVRARVAQGYTKKRAPSLQTGALNGFFGGNFQCPNRAIGSSSGNDLSSVRAGSSERLSAGSQ